jgi:diacylglycerol kinase (ATP)
MAKLCALRMPFPAKTLVLVNPTANRGRAGRVAATVREFFAVKKFPADFAETSNANDFEQRARAAASLGYRTVAALGGDGAAHFLLRGALGTSVALGIIPAGSGNDIAMGLGIPLDPVAAAQSLMDCVPRSVDVVRARLAGGIERVFIGAGGIGLDAEANQLATGRFRNFPGVTRYIAGALAALVNAHPLCVVAEFDEGRWDGDVLFAAVANSPTYGAGVHIAPDARMDDGYLNLVLVAPMSFGRVLEAIPIVLRDGDLRWAEIRRVRTRRLALRADRRAPFHGDGEILGEAPIEFEVLPRAVQVVAPV